MIQTDKIKLYAKALRLPNLASSCEEILHQAQLDSPSYLEFVEQLLQQELHKRQQNDFQRRLKQAKLPLNHDLDHFDFNYSAGITKPQLKQLRELLWLEQNFNVVLLGASGLGKSFIASGLVYEAVKQGYRGHAQKSVGDFFANRKSSNI